MVFVESWTFAGGVEGILTCGAWQNTQTHTHTELMFLRSCDVVAVLSYLDARAVLLFGDMLMSFAEDSLHRELESRCEISSPRVYTAE